MTDDYRLQLPDLPGHVEVELYPDGQVGDYFTRNRGVVIVRHVLNGESMYAGTLVAHPRMFEDAAVLREVVIAASDRWLRPWRYPDRYRWPSFDTVLFPHATAWCGWWRRAWHGWVGRVDELREQWGPWLHRR